MFGARLAQTLENLLVQFQPDVELSATSNEDTDIFFFMLVETTRGIPVADSVVIRNPHGIILKPVSSEGEPCYKRIGWGSGEFIDKIPAYGVVEDLWHASDHHHYLINASFSPAGGEAGFLLK